MNQIHWKMSLTLAAHIVCALFFHVQAVAWGHELRIQAQLKIDEHRSEAILQGFITTPSNMAITSECFYEPKRPGPDRQYYSFLPKKLQRAQFHDAHGEIKILGSNSQLKNSTPKPVHDKKSMTSKNQ